MTFGRIGIHRGVSFLILVGLLLSSLSLAGVESVSAQTTTPLVRNPSGGTTHGLYYYRNYRIIADALAAAWPKNPASQRQALAYMDSYVQGPDGVTTSGGQNYFELYTKEAKRAWLKGYIKGFVNKTQPKKFEKIILDAEEASKWESVRLAEGSVRQVLQGTFQAQVTPEKNLRALLNNVTRDIATLCLSFGGTAQDSRNRMLKKENWQPSQIEFFYRFLAPERYKKHQLEPKWSTKIALPNGSSRYVPNVGEGTTTSTHPDFPYTEYYHIVKFKTLCDEIAKDYAGTIPSSPLEDLDTAFGLLSGYGILKQVVTATAIKGASAQLLTGGKVVGPKRIPKVNPGRMTTHISKKGSEAFAAPTITTKFGEKSVNMKLMFGQVNLAIRSKLFLVKLVEKTISRMTQDPVVGKYIDEAFIDAVARNTEIKECLDSADGLCYYTFGRRDNNRRYAFFFDRIELKADLVGTKNGEPLALHEALHALAGSRGDVGNFTWHRSLLEISPNPWVEAWTEWFTQRITTRANTYTYIGYKVETNFAQAIYDAYTYRLRKQGINNPSLRAEEDIARLQFTGEFTPAALDQLFPEVRTSNYFKYDTSLATHIKNKINADTSTGKEQSLKELIKDIDGMAKKLYK